MSKRINKAIELLEAGQPVCSTGSGPLTYENGKKMAKTWADLIRVGMEHGPLDMVGLHQYMRGLKDGGPTNSGHLTPCVTIELPVEGISEGVVRFNAWMFKQALAAGVHGILLCHANTPGAVKAFIESSRYPFHKQGLDNGLDTGKRGSAGQGMAGEVWGMAGPEYCEKADVWPLNPDGELLMGLKIENRIALSNVMQTCSVPGVAYVEWGPGDMGFAFDHIDAHDPPYPPEMVEARARVMQACKEGGWRFFEAVTEAGVVDSIKEGISICGCKDEKTAFMAREYAGRTMPV